MLAKYFIEYYKNTSTKISINRYFRKFSRLIFLKKERERERKKMNSFFPKFLSFVINNFSERFNNRSNLKF